MGRIVYCDYSATTYVKKEVLDEMLPYFSMEFGNASAVYSIGRNARTAVENSRKIVSNALGCKKEEIYFTSSGSEADNMVLLGIARANKNKGKHIITSKIEHLAVLNTCKQLEKEGFELSYIGVDKNGFIDLEELKNSIREDTILISVMMANNEIGTIEPIKEIGKIAKEKNVIFHSDCVQAIGHMKIDVTDLGLDALALSAHKFYGPKGIGTAYIKKGISFNPVILGGHQECSKRAGTENVAGIVGIAKAIELANINIYSHNENLLYLRNSLKENIIKNIPGTVINADVNNRLPGHMSISIEDIDARNLLLMLDMNGICVSAGSACNSNSENISHVLNAIGMSKEQALSTIRITLGDANTTEDIEYISTILEDIVKKMRK